MPDRQCDMTQRILRVYDRASEQDLADGLAWYDRARAIAEELSPDDVRRGAGVIAALSPRCSWAQNVQWASDVLQWADGPEGLDATPRVHTTGQRVKATRIARYEDPLDASEPSPFGTVSGGVLTGPKERAFCANIIGDEQAVTVDVWAARIAEGRENHTAPSGARYRRIAAAYAAAAALRDVAPRDMQAAVWTRYRRELNKNHEDRRELATA